MWSSSSKSSQSSNANRAALFSGSERGSSPSQGDSSNSALLYEQQNDVRLEELGSKVSTLHKITMDINNEIHDQNSVLDNTGDAFGSMRGSLSGSVNRLLQMSAIRSHRYMCYVVSLILTVFLLLYVFGGYLIGLPQS